MTSSHLFAYIFLRFVVHVAIGNSLSCFEVGPYLKEETGLSAEKFWGSKTQGVEHCMKLCVRQAQCQSINYDLTSKFCELNKTLRNGGQTKSSTNLYSEFKSWPKTFDPHCSSRPCRENEVCIPKTLLMSSADSSGCGHACMLFGNSVCPMPTAGTFVGRKVGSVNVVTCPKGKTGGGQATCEADLKWKPQIPGCVDIHNHSCSDNTLCSKIGAKCTTERKCQCEHSMYNVTTSQCQPAVLRLDGESEQKDTVDGSLQFYQEHKWKTVCKENWHWKATSVACRQIRSDLIYGGTFHTDWKGRASFTPSEVKFKNLDQCNGNEDFLQDCDKYKVDSCDSLQLALTCFKYNVSEAANKTLALFESISALESEPVTIDSENMTGILAVKVNGRWGIVCKKGFHGKDVACRSLNPNWKLREVKDIDISNLPNNQLLYTQSVKCDGKEKHLFFCENDGWNIDESCSDSRILNITLRIFEVRPFLKEETGLGAEKFWGSKTQGVEHCMKLCVRQAQCQSINYDLKSKFCELNKTLRNGGQTKSSTNLYSEFKSWPKTFDPHCSSRPCRENEVCIPKTLLTSSADSSGCGHACMLFGNSVCPMPTAGTFVGRKVGSVNVVTCPKGKTGGGQATCEADLKWRPPIPGCVDIHNLSCSNNTMCSKIGAKCSPEGKCQCEHSMYNVITSQCQPVLRLDGGSEQNDTVDGFLQFYHENEWKAVCEEHWKWKATSVACRQIRSDLIYGGTFHTWTASTPNQIKLKDIDCTGNEEFLQDCKKGEVESCNRPELALTCFKYNVSEAANKTLALFESISALESEPVTIDSENMTGILAVKVNGRWGIVCKNDFNGKDVACQSLNPNWKSEKDEGIDISNQKTNQPLYYTKKVRCEKESPHLFFCENEGWNILEPCSDGKIVYLECVVKTV